MSHISRVIISIIIISSGFCSSDKVISIPKWGIFESELRTEKEYLDPVADVDLMVKITRPDGSVFNHFGFYNGEHTWKFRVMPDMEGLWTYECYFSESTETISGHFKCIRSDKSGPLAVDRDNPYWLVFKDSPPKQIRSFHVGDRFFASNFEYNKRELFLDWIEKQGYNMLSVASHYLNRQQEGRGIGWDTPKLWPIDPSEYQKLESYLYELEKRNILVYPFAGFFGRAAQWPTNPDEQEKYIKYTLARLAPFRNIVFNVAGPEPILKPEDYQNGRMKTEDINRLAHLIKQYDPYGHLLSVHNRTRNEQKDYEYDPFIFESWEDYSTLQGGKSDNTDDVYNFIVESRKVVKPVFAQEVLWYGNMYHAELNEESLRKKAITLIMAGSFINFGDMNGNSSSGFSGCLDPDSSHLEAHNTIHKVWDFFDELPFLELSPRPELINGAYCLSNGAGKHLIYVPGGKSFSLNLNLPFSGKWINPRDMKTSKNNIIISNINIAPPDSNDWFFYIDDKTDKINY